MRNAPRPGVTTVLDALCLGDLGFDKERIQTFQDGVADLDALADTGLLKAEHFLHLRCEVPARDMLDLFDPVADASARAHGQPDGSQPGRRPVRRHRRSTARCAAATARAED